MKRRQLFRAGAAALLVLLAFFLYDIGKGSVLLLDNKTVEAGGKTLEAFATVRISVDGGEPIELYPRDRDKVELAGAAHRIEVTVFSQGGQELSTKSARFRFSGKSRMYLLSLPAFVGGADEWLTEFSPAVN